MTIIETIHAGAFIVSEAPGFQSRETAVIAASQTIVAGQVLGKTAVVAGVTSSSAADAGNTGDGAMTLDVTTPVAANAKNGVYRAVCIEPATDGGTFAVLDPDGVEIGRYVVGAPAFNNQVKFVIADGLTDFAAGDAFSIAVGIESVTDEQFKALDLSATDGVQNATAIAVYAATTGVGETKKIAILSRNAEVRAADLSWPDGITTVQKAAAIEQLGALGIVLR